MNAKRQLLIETALDLFYKNGINRIGINEILSTSGVAKRTLYSHFSSKESLIHAALEQRHQTFVAWLQQQLAHAETNQEVIEKLFISLSNWFENKEPQLGDFRGCFFINTAAEFSDQKNEIFKFCHSHKENVRTIIEKALPSPNNTLVDAICIMKEGVIVTAHLSGHGRNEAIKCIKLLQNFTH